MCYRIETIIILLKRYLNDEVQCANFSVDRAYPRDIDSIPVKSVCVEKTSMCIHLIMTVSGYPR